MLKKYLIANLLLWLMCASVQAGDTILTLELKSGELMSFSAEDIRTLPTTSFETSTIWTEEPVTFTGVELDILLDAAGVESGVLRAAAINDYSVEIPVTDAVAGGPIVAYALDGEPMSVREKGPLWIVYPYDSSVEYQTEVIYSRSIWQLNRIAVLP